MRGTPRFSILLALSFAPLVVAAQTATQSPRSDNFRNLVYPALVEPRP